MTHLRHPTHPIPPGTRDILPDEMRELRRLSLALIDTFERFGYGEVATPTIEYEDVLARGDERGAPVAYRFFDESGELLAMRSDMTIPIARLVANRYATAATLALRFWQHAEFVYLASGDAFPDALAAAGIPGWWTEGGTVERVEDFSLRRIAVPAFGPSAIWSIGSVTT